MCNTTQSKCVSPNSGLAGVDHGGGVRERTIELLTAGWSYRRIGKEGVGAGGREYARKLAGRLARGGTGIALRRGQHKFCNRKLQPRHAAFVRVMTLAQPGVTGLQLCDLLWLNFQVKVTPYCVHQVQTEVRVRWKPLRTLETVCCTAMKELRIVV